LRWPVGVAEMIALVRFLPRSVGTAALIGQQGRFMAVKVDIEKLDDVPEPLRQHYALKDGKYRLALDGDHPDTARLAEFRSNNIELTKSLARFEGIDPDAVKTDREKLAEYQKAKPDEKITTLEAALATEKTAHGETRKRADGFVIEGRISDAFLKAGGRPEARAFVVTQAAGQFTVDENGELRGTKHSPNRPGELMSLDEWLTLQTKQNAFCFFESTGGGAHPRRGDAGAGGNVLRNPTAQDLGRWANEIASGQMKVVYE
jgi:hypothetical protein